MQAIQYRGYTIEESAKGYDFRHENDYFTVGNGQTVADCTKQIDELFRAAKPECYVKFLDCKNKFKETVKDFATYELAWQWIVETFEKPSKEFIHYY